eukprot:jgi/Botrbrau1/17787/Bobra.0127s0038.1
MMGLSAKCELLADIFHLSAKDLAKELELYLVSRERFDVKDVTEDLLESLEEELKAKRTKSWRVSAKDHRDIRELDILVEKRMYSMLHLLAHR